MCGIAGYTGQELPGVLEAMNRAVSHRGPDAQGRWTSRDGAVHLAHSRLAIIDRDSGSQPMLSDDGRLALVYNGEIYNAGALRTELEKRGHSFRSQHADTEVLLHGYREWGVSLPRHLNGMWSFVLYDRDLNHLFGSRDRFGEKPLYYAESKQGFVFGSELGAVRAHTQCPRRVDPMALRKYFAYGFIPAPHTLLQGVKKLPAGHWFLYDIVGRGLQVQRYWQFVLEPAIVPKNSEHAWAEELLNLLKKSVRERLRADVGVGILLSGGVDSSAIAALAAEVSGRGALPAFTLGFDDRSFDETRYAELAGKLVGCRVNVERTDLCAAEEAGRALAARLDEPLADPSLVPTFQVAALARRHVSVALSGDGGDELFAGYDPFRALTLARAHRACCPRPVHDAIVHLMRFLPVGQSNMSLDFRLRRFLRGVEHPPSLWLPTWMSPLSQAELNELFQQPAPMEGIFSEAIAAWERGRGLPLADRALYYFTDVYLENDILPKSDRASMLNGLEVRAPFLDLDVINFARKLPTCWKLRRGKTKYLLKQAVRSLLPAKLIDRPKKGFGMPIGSWLKRGSFPVDISELPPSLSPGFAQRAEKSHRDGTEDQRAFLWSAHLLAAWLKAQPL
ncbi:asparagine synthase (glutamine-hydrolyzing) [Opitutaceae bacterium EW11]|nr:asparagine synthase (glutamine-hydrolyzing) [Opitutaceae bacterium EW11]